MPTEESVAAGDVAAALEAIRSACPGIPVGVSTAAWIVKDAARRPALVRSWSVLPDYASVNVHEEGAAELMRLLIERGVGIEAGVARAALRSSSTAVSPASACASCSSPPAPPATSTPTWRRWSESWRGSIARVASRRPVDLADDRARGAPRLRHLGVGLEDTLTLPDGSRAEGNAALVAAAIAITSRRPRP